MRLMLLAGSAIAMLTTGSMAAETCIPVAPARWDGEIQAPSLGWLTITTFEENNCSFVDDQLNGLDAWVADINQHAGLTLSVTSTDGGALNKGVQGYFLNDKCERGGFWGYTQNKTPFAAPAPEGAKWIVVSTEPGGMATQVALESAGRTCEVAPDPVKKKKKRRR